MNMKQKQDKRFFLQNDLMNIKLNQIPFVSMYRYESHWISPDLMIVTNGVIVWHLDLGYSARFH